MSRILDIGERVELVPMDMHFHDISLAFYQKEKRKGTRYLIHSYSRMEGIDDRITFVRDSAKILGGLESREDGLLYFSCESEHLAGAKRIFLEACKIATGDKVHMLPLEIDDKKAVETPVRSLPAVQCKTTGKLSSFAKIPNNLSQEVGPNSK